MSLFGRLIIGETPSSFLEAKDRISEETLPFTIQDPPEVAHKDRKKNPAKTRRSKAGVKKPEKRKKSFIETSGISFYYIADDFMP